MASHGKIRVGIIGLSPDRGWGMEAHLPSLRALPDDYEVTALSTSRIESAREAGQKFGIAHVFDSPQALAACPEVDLVAVSVKVPTHLDLVTAALNAGKHVYCEWPLGRDAAEAETMTALAKSKGVLAIAGLQMRASPGVAYVRDLVRQGYVGEVLSTSMIGSGGNWGDAVDSFNAYLQDKRNGATMMTIPFGHTMDGFCWTLGEWREISATLAVRRPNVKVNQTGEIITKTASDQIAITGTLEGGAVASVHYRGGMARSTNFLWEINGTKGDLLLTAPSGHMQMAMPLIRGAQGGDALAELPIPAAYHLAPGAPQGRPYNVAQAYARLAKGLREGGDAGPTFVDALRHHHMLEAMQRSADEGRRVTFA